ncbi:MAG: toll/interleukin-1 receptor domain-containing protein [Planctomycetaceae bacterium]
MDSQRQVAYEQLKLRRTEVESATYIWEDDGRFDTWVGSVKNALVRLFGRNSEHVQDFEKLFARRYIRFPGKSPSFYEDGFNRRRGEIMGVVNAAIEDFENFELPAESPNAEVANSAASNKTDEGTTMQKVFISHSSIDKDIVDKFVDILEAMKISHEQIHFSSKPGYGTNFGENFLQDIRDKLRGDTLVFFMLSQNFYSSTICMCEMGAAWALSTRQIPIIIPPFRFEDIKGVLPNTNGLVINDKDALNELKNQIKKLFSIPGDHPKWEEKREAAILNINEKIKAALKVVAPQTPQVQPASTSNSKGNLKVDNSLSLNEISILKYFAQRDTEFLFSDSIRQNLRLKQIDFRDAINELKAHRLISEGVIGQISLTDIGVRAAKYLGENV